MRLACLATSLLLLTAMPAAIAQVVVTSGQPVVGSSNPITPEPPVVRRATTPCVVPLFTNLEFADYSAKTYSYTPPASCPGPWAQVVFTADFTVTAGIQFDRTAEFFLGHANLYFGTTAEPAPGFSPSWHVEKDVTQLTTLLESAQSGEADLGNFVGESGGTDYNGIIYANATLEFYPVVQGQSAAYVPDVVVPMPDAAGGGVFVSSSKDALSQTVTLPRNVEALYLDIYAQSQANDEFWWICAPNDVAAVIETCGGTGFRETEITIDGIPAGVAPIYPWIYTGGVDPNLWIPITGVQTLDFKPYRVDLSPFAGKLDDGAQHTVAVHVDNAQNGFTLIGTLFAYEDHGSSVVTGTVSENTLKFEPGMTTNNAITVDAQGNVSGYVTTASNRSYQINGTVHTSQGEVITAITHDLSFSSKQNVKIDETDYVEGVQQQTTDTTTTVQSNGKGFSGTQTAQYSYPFAFTYDATLNNDGSETVTSTSNQRDYLTDTAGPTGGAVSPPYKVSEAVMSEDALQFDANGNFTGSSGKSSASYNSSADNLNIFKSSLASNDYALTSVFEQTCTGTTCVDYNGSSANTKPDASGADIHPGAVTLLHKKNP